MKKSPENIFFFDKSLENIINFITKECLTLWSAFHLKILSIITKECSTLWSAFLQVNLDCKNLCWGYHLFDTNYFIGGVSGVALVGELFLSINSFPI